MTGMSSGGPADPEFVGSRDASAAELAALPASTADAVRVIERCIASRHVVEVDYVDEGGRSEKLQVWPAFIRTSTAGHVVLWAMSPERGHWLQLRLDRVQSGTDTGKAFNPTW